MAILDNIKFARRFLRVIQPRGFDKEKKTIEQDYKNLSHYGIIGNLETCALIASDGSIDWMCLPHLESPSVFASLLDKKKGGYFVVQPRISFTGHQQYIERTNVLQTTFDCSSGKAVITDFMPPFKKRSVWHKSHILFRKVECTKGYVPFLCIFKPRFQYAKVKPKFSVIDTGVLASSKDERLYLDALLEFDCNRDGAESLFTLSKGEEMWFLLQYNTHISFNARERERELKNTISYWQKWAHKCDRSKCVFNGPWHDLVVRSGLVLKLLTHGDTGAIAAAATTSLPETIGGSRNWDYRFNWLRDSVFTVQALYNLGHYREVRGLFNWYKRIYKGVKASDIQIVYGLHGEKELPEKTLRHFSGYKKSKPVRIGNAAYKQRQHDIYGELLNVAFETSRYGETISKNEWKLLYRIVNHVCRIWNEKDASIWEMRTRYRHYLYSKLMCWVALDRGIRIAEKRNFKAPLERWRKVRDEIKEAIIEKGYNKRLKSFTQYFGGTALDASNLLIPIMGLLPFDDFRVKGTIEATLKYLTKDGLVYRYKRSDNLKGKEGAFILCTFWLVDALLLSGQRKRAEKLYMNLLKHISPLGLFSEEIDVDKKILLGNFPQALSHVGLINSALYIGIARGKEARGPRPLGLLGSRLLSILKLGRLFSK